VAASGKMSDCNAIEVATREFKSWLWARGKINKFTKVMGSDGNRKYLPMFSLPYVEYAFAYGF